MKRKGFTLIELMIVVAIIIILTASSTVVFNNISKNDVNNVSVQCQKIIEAVRNEAVATREWRSIVLHYSTNTITYSQEGNNKTFVLPITVKFTEEKNSLNCYINYGSYDNINRYNNDYIFGINGIKDITIWLNPYGKPNIRIFFFGEGEGNLSALSSGYGYFRLSSRNNTTISQVMIHGNSGESEIKWIKGF